MTSSQTLDAPGHGSPLRRAVRRVADSVRTRSARYPETLDLATVADRGYALVHLLDDGSAERVQRVVNTLDLPADHPFFASPAHVWGPEARRIDQDLKAILRPRMHQLLPGHEIFMVAVTSKGARSAQAVKFHHDWTYTDERVARPVFLWCPLVPCGPDNGSLQLVPGSHRWTSGIRPSRCQEATEANQDDLRQLAVRPRFRAGDAVAFDPALLHGSDPNPTSSLRPAITIALAPRTARLLHFHEDPSGELTGFEVDESFFTLNEYGRPPAGRPEVTPWTVAVTTADFARAVATRRGEPTGAT